MSKLWKGEAAKIRRRVLGAVNTRMKKRVGESDLGRVWSGARSDRDYVESKQAALYAAAMGISLDDARARISAQREAVGASFVPGKGYIIGA